MAENLPFEMYILCGGDIEITAGEHPNIMKFRGILLRLNEPSNKAPNGSRGHRILVKANVAKRRLDTLIGMGLNYAPSMKEHAQQRKVGVITGAKIEGNDLWVTADIWKHDFPEAVRDLKRPGLGMSMEINRVRVKDVNASVWELEDFCFLGGTILEKHAAAYYRTEAIAARAEERRQGMAVKVKAKKETGSDCREVADLAASKAAELVFDKFSPVIEELTASVASLSATVDGLSMDGAADVRSCEMKSAKKKKDDDDEDDGGDDGDDDDKDDDDKDDDDEDDDDDIDSEIDKGSLKDMGDEPNDEDDDDPGHLSEESENQGDKTTPDERQGKTISKGIVGNARLTAALQREKKLRKINAGLSAQVQKLNKRVKSLGRQVQFAASRQDRRSAALPSDLVGLLAKSGINASELNESGQKLTVHEVDAILASTRLDPVDRMAFKNKLMEHGMMDEGRVVRG